MQEKNGVAAIEKDKQRLKVIDYWAAPIVFWLYDSTNKDNEDIPDMCWNVFAYLGTGSAPLQLNGL